MARYYGPRRRAKPTPSGPPSAVEQWLGKILLGIMSLSAIVYGGLFVLGTLYVVFTKGIPAVYHAVADWGNDVATTVSEHEWQYTDAVLYMGIVLILVLRYTRLWPWLCEWF